MGEVIILFVGHDDREAIGSVVFAQSVHERCVSPHPVAIARIGRRGFNDRDGSNSFTYSRFLVPFYMNFRGWAIFIDGADCLLRSDLVELMGLRNSYYAVQVVKRAEYTTRDSVKYRGTELEAPNENYRRKNWSSVMLWNCEHPMNSQLTPEFIAHKEGSWLHQLGWLSDHRIGALPEQWNVLIGENGEDCVYAKLVHYTLGIPAFAQYSSALYADEWRSTLHRAQRGVANGVGIAHLRRVEDLI